MFAKVDERRMVLNKFLILLTWKFIFKNVVSCRKGKFPTICAVRSALK